MGQRGLGRSPMSNGRSSCRGLGGIRLQPWQRQERHRSSDHRRSARVRKSTQSRERRKKRGKDHTDGPEPGPQLGSGPSESGLTWYALVSARFRRPGDARLGMVQVGPFAVIPWSACRRQL